MSALYSKLPLGAKLALAPALCCVMLLLVAAAAYWGTVRDRSAMQQINDVSTPKQLAVMGLQRAILGAQSLTYRYLASKTASFSDEILTDIESKLAKEVEVVKQLAAAVGVEAVDVSARPMADAIDEYVKLVLGAVDIAKEDMSFAATEMVRVDGVYDKLSAEIAALVDRRGQESKSAVTQAEETGNRTLVLIAAATALSVIFAALVSWVVRAGILRQVAHIADASQRLREGDLCTTTVTEGNDAIAITSRALQETVMALKGTIQAIGASTASIDQAINELAAGNEDFSVRTERAAATLQQAASDMTGLASRVIENARQVAQVAEISVESKVAAERGGIAVGDVVCVMESIAASSQRVQEVTAVIDTIAFQTNILALNAAVEAARAGEQGRGFSVVAAEVRTLAQRSARAAAEIKRLVGDSVSSVKTGSARVQEAGDAMNSIVVRARELSVQVEGIAQSASLQSQTVESVALSICELETATQQNAALVEQAAAAAGSVRSESARLLSTVQAFRVS